MNVLEIGVCSTAALGLLNTFLILKVLDRNRMRELANKNSRADLESLYRSVLGVGNGSSGLVAKVAKIQSVLREQWPATAPEPKHSDNDA